MWTRVLWELSVFPKNTTQWPQLRLELGLLDPDSRVLSIKQPWGSNYPFKNPVIPSFSDPVWLYNAVCCRLSSWSILRSDQQLVGNSSWCLQVYCCFPTTNGGPCSGYRYVTVNLIVSWTAVALLSHYKHISLCGVIWLTKDGSKILYWKQPMNADKLYMSLSPNTITANWPITFVDHTYITPSPDKHYSWDSEGDFHSICRNVRQQQCFFWELTSPRRSQNLTNYFLVLTIQLVAFSSTGIWYTILKAVTKISVVVNVRNVTWVTDPCPLSLL